MTEYNDIQGLDDTMPDWNNDQPEWVNEAEKKMNDTPSIEDHRTSLGKCPRCGADVFYGKYGAYCKDKCGMTLSKIFDRVLKGYEVNMILHGSKVYLENMVNKDGKKYSAFFVPDGIEEYSYTTKDGKLISGLYHYKFKKEYPSENKNKS